MTFFSNALQNVARYQDKLWKAAFLVSISYCGAKLINLMVAHTYLPVEVPTEFRAPERLSENFIPTYSISDISARNIFDSKAHLPKGVSENELDSGEIRPTTLPIELLGTLVFQHSKYSAALMAERKGGHPEYYSVGESIAGARIGKIERFRVILEVSGHLESLELKAAESKIGGLNLFNPEPIAPSKPGGLEELRQGVYAVPKELLDSTLANFSQVLTQARMVPNLTGDNKTDGFKIFAIKDGSIYDTLKLKDNDIIKSVNGQALDSFEKATGLFSALRNEKTISIDVTRGGTNMNLTFEIQK